MELVLVIREEMFLCLQVDQLMLSKQIVRYRNKMKWFEEQHFEVSWKTLFACESLLGDFWNTLKNTFEMYFNLFNLLLKIKGKFSDNILFLVQNPSKITFPREHKLWESKKTLQIYNLGLSRWKKSPTSRTIFIKIWQIGVRESQQQWVQFCSPNRDGTRS